MQPFQFPSDGCRLHRSGYSRHREHCTRHCERYTRHRSVAAVIVGVAAPIVSIVASIAAVAAPIGALPRPVRLLPASSGDFRGHPAIFAVIVANDASSQRLPPFIGDKKTPGLSRAPALVDVVLCAV